MSKHGEECRSDATTSDADSESESQTIRETDDDTEAETEDETGSGNRDDEQADRSHLDDVADGSGCTEIWEHLSEHRDTAETERE
jgi:hypothetical protein